MYRFDQKTYCFTKDLTLLSARPKPRHDERCNGTAHSGLPIDPKPPQVTTPAVRTDSPMDRSSLGQSGEFRKSRVSEAFGSRPFCSAPKPHGRGTAIGIQAAAWVPLHPCLRSDHSKNGNLTLRRGGIQCKHPGMKRPFKQLLGPGIPYPRAPSTCLEGIWTL